MDSIFKHLFESDSRDKKNKKHKSSKRSSLQGINLLNTRKNIYDRLEFNLSNYTSTNKIVEGNTNMGNNVTINGQEIDLSKFTAEQKTNIKNIATNFTQKKERYNELMESYKDKYATFVNDFNELKKAVFSCKTKCETAHQNAEQIKACQVGCHLAGPYIKECTDTFIATGTNSCETTGKQKCQNFAPKSETHNLNVIVDKNQVSLLDGCCDCGGGNFGKPKMSMGGITYRNCDRFDKDENASACNTSFNNFKKPEMVSSSKPIVERYTEIVKLNEDMLKIADDLLDYTNRLKQYNIDIANSRNDIISNFSENSSRLQYIKDEIAKYTKLKTNTLDMMVSDGKLKSKAYEMRSYVWLILAIAFGGAALNQIRNN
mgnify:CR=1 FL=1|tara:strand:- start:8169 stop:9290 length:1122 start_codon:yes stop_codon:yes gene_type:complete